MAQGRSRVTPPAPRRCATGRSGRLVGSRTGRCTRRPPATDDGRGAAEAIEPTSATASIRSEPPELVAVAALAVDEPVGAGCGCRTRNRAEDLIEEATEPGEEAAPDEGRRRLTKLPPWTMRRPTGAHPTDNISTHRSKGCRRCNRSTPSNPSTQSIPSRPVDPVASSPSSRRVRRIVASRRSVEPDGPARTVERRAPSSGERSTIDVVGGRARRAGRWLGGRPVGSKRDHLRPGRDDPTVP